MSGAILTRPALRVWLVRLAPLWCALAFIALQSTAAKQEIQSHDSYRYGIKTLELLGVSPQQAHEQSLHMICERMAWQDERLRALSPSARYDRPSRVPQSVNECVKASPKTFGPADPRYIEIFDTRPGFPLLAAPAVKLFGLDKGMVMTSLAIGGAGGLAIYLLLTLAGAARGPALVGQLLFYALPTGYWSTRMLTEGTMLIVAVAFLAGAWLLLQRRIVAGLAVTAAAGILGFAVKYAQVPMIGIALTGAAVGIWIFDRQRRHVGTVVLGAVSLGAFAAGLVLPRLLHWPDLQDSLQDSFTLHFTHPDVPDPMHRLIDLNGAYWSQWGQEQVLHPLLVLACIAGAVALWRWSRSLALIVVAVSATGIAAEIAHPAWSEADRLYVQLWLTAVIGLPLLWPLLRGRGTGASEGTTEPEDAPGTGGTTFSVPTQQSRARTGTAPAERTPEPGTGTARASAESAPAGA